MTPDLCIWAAGSQPYRCLLPLDTRSSMPPSLMWDFSLALSVTGLSVPFFHFIWFSWYSADFFKDKYLLCVQEQFLGTA